MFLPLARPSTKLVTFSVLRLKTATVKPLLSIFMTRFSPITASPISPMSALLMHLPPVECLMCAPGLKWIEKRNKKA